MELLDKLKTLAIAVDSGRNYAHKAGEWEVYFMHEVYSMSKDTIDEVVQQWSYMKGHNITCDVLFMA